MNLSSHQKRLLTAGLLLPPVLYCIVSGGGFKLGLILLISSLGQWEYYALFWPGWQRLGRKLFGLFLGALLLVGSSYGDTGLCFGTLLLAFWLDNFKFLLVFGGLGRQDSEPPQGTLVLGLLYVPAVLQFFTHYSALETFLVLGAVVASDVGAYYAGGRFGGPKIWPRVSPKKTWSGSLGGLLTCLLYCLALGLSFGVRAWPVWLALGLALNLAAQLGDFLESALKRVRGVKDSGHVLPGHGGVLDRVDALLAATTAYAAMRYFNVFF